MRVSAEDINAFLSSKSYLLPSSAAAVEMSLRDAERVVKQHHLVSQQALLVTTLNSHITGRSKHSAAEEEEDDGPSTMHFTKSEEKLHNFISQTSELTSRLWARYDELREDEKRTLSPSGMYITDGFRSFDGAVSSGYDIEEIMGEVYHQAASDPNQYGGGESAHAYVVGSGDDDVDHALSSEGSSGANTRYQKKTKYDFESTLSDFNVMSDQESEQEAMLSASLHHSYAESGTPGVEFGIDDVYDDNYDSRPTRRGGSTSARAGGERASTGWASKKKPTTSVKYANALSLAELREKTRSSAAAAAAAAAEKEAAAGGWRDLGSTMVRWDDDEIVV